MDIVAQVHRFHDKVAVYVGSGETVYLSPSQAAELGGALQKCAVDIVSVKFTNSNFSTVEIVRQNER